MPRRIDYLKSGVLPDDYPAQDRPELAIAGRSNAGKSSFINAIAKTQVARTSQEPGKTRTLNFYNVGEFYRIVDMPGYGFATRSGGEQAGWQSMVETYLMNRPNLVGLILLIDIRREWTADEEMILQFCHKNNLPVAVALTKADQMGKNDIRHKEQVIKRVAKTAEVWATSAKKNEGVLEMEKHLFDSWILPYLRGPA